MKIAYVTETWPPEINGVALTAARAVRYLRSRGHQLQLVRPRQSPLDDGDQETVLVPGMPIPLYPDLRMGWPVQRLLYRNWRDAPPDLVHIATEGPLGWSAGKAARRLGIVTTSDLRTRFDEYGRHYLGKAFSGVIQAYLRSFHNSTARTFVPTHEMAALLRSAGFENVAVSERGVDADAFSPLHRTGGLRSSWGVSESSVDVPVALYVGRLAREKNLSLVFRSFEALRALSPEAKLVVVGDGPLRAAFEKAHPAAIFAGVQTGGALAACYASADLFLFPSLTETFGNVTLEAMASGLPVVAFDSAAARVHIRDGANGYALPVDDEAGFVLAACRLATDPELRMRLGVAARCDAEAMQWKEVLGRFEAQLLAASLSKLYDDVPKLASS